ncbi:MAG: hypothetical protein ACTSU5_16290 [Promethearchaeota archaeon]
MAMRERERPPSGQSVTDREREAKLRRMKEIQQRLRELEEHEGNSQTETPTGPSPGSEVEPNLAYLTRELEDLKQGFGGTGVSELPQEALAEVEEELRTLEREIAEEAGNKEIVSVFEKVRELHPWIAEERYEFMYAIPEDKKGRHYREWMEEWSKVLFDYAKEAVLHVLYTKELATEPPFANFREREGAILDISEHLVKKKLARWMTKKKESLRVYWRSIEEWAEKMVEWARENALLDPVLVSDIREAEQPFSSLPEDDLLTVFKTLKKQKRADLLKLEDGTLAIKFKL